ncbi:hypothetical protein, partial [Herbaspirillum seropedicae]|uniref:hypothetical protein n=1 Tax=Herbaspirillum seropedicae TaxID=964 RepID=UPI00286CCFA9
GIKDRMTAWLPSEGSGKWVNWRGSVLRANQQAVTHKRSLTLKDDIFEVVGAASVISEVGFNDEDLSAAK